MKRSISCVFLIVGFAIPLFAQSTAYRWTLDEVFRIGATIKTLGATQWTNDGKGFSLLEVDPVTKQRHLYKVNAADGKRERLMDGSKLVVKPGEAPMRIGSYEYSADGENILVTGTLTSRGTKTGGNFGVFNLRSNTFRILSDAKEEQAMGLAGL